jgi:hypothetical protein
MATVTHFGPFPDGVPQGLPPGGEVSYSWGEFPPDFRGTAVIAAHPWQQPYTQALAVTSLSIAVTSGGVHSINWIVKNTYNTFVLAYTQWITIIEP